MTAIETKAKELGITVEELKARRAKLIADVRESNKPKSKRVSREVLERRSMIRATEKIERLRKEYADRVYEIHYVDVVEHERHMECGIVTICHHKRATVVRIK